jgi:hypothetical protein
MRHPARDTIRLSQTQQDALRKILAKEPLERRLLATLYSLEQRRLLKVRRSGLLVLPLDPPSTTLRSAVSLRYPSKGDQRRTALQLRRRVRSTQPRSG